MSLSQTIIYLKEQNSKIIIIYQIMRDFIKLNKPLWDILYVHVLYIYIS